MVLDHGEVTTEAEEASAGRLVSGSPFLVMELATGGSLRDRHRRMGWYELKSVLLTVLDALAHAHARSVVHRDIKPSNILICSSDDARPGLKLADFGLAHALDHRIVREGSVESGQGTPFYMAPEQCWGLWRDYGPWTDLYALGCVVYELITGRPPFLGESFTELALQHQNVKPPRLAGKAAFPDGFEEWLMTLVEKDPDRRFQRAADAAWGLLGLGDPVDVATGAVPHYQRAEETSSQRRAVLAVDGLAGLSTLCAEMAGSELASSSFGPTSSAATDTIKDLRSPQSITITASDLPSRWLERAETWSPDKVGVKDDDSEPWLATEAGSDLRKLPPMPGDWRYEGMDSPIPSMRLVGAGLGLYGLRTVPLVDRAKERDLIWDTLARVRRTGYARAVLLQGPAGVGKSRLVEWISGRAHELGSATVLQAIHNPIPGPSDGIARMVSRHLRCVGLGRAEALQRIRRRQGGRRGEASEDECRALTELIAPAGPSGADRDASLVRLASPTERYALVRRLLERTSRSRPVMVWLDDVQWGPDAVAFVEHLLDHQQVRASPILVLLTVRDEALADQPEVAAQLHALLARANAECVAVGPLAEAQRAELIQELLGLEGELAARVEERTGGNPLFAVELVGDWVQRGILEVGPRGFVLRPDAEVALPDDLHQVWSSALERVLGERGDDARQAIEVAAVLGLQVDAGEWVAVCRAASVGVPADLVDALVHRRLAYPNDAGWAFAHGMLRESVVRAAHEGRWAQLNLLCAQTLGELYDNGAPGISGRLGRHLLEGHDYAAAVEPLLRGARERLLASDFRAAHGLLGRREGALEQLHADRNDPRLAAGWALRAWLLRLEGRFEDAEAMAVEATAQARRAGDRASLAAALKAQGSVARLDGQQTAAGSHLESAMALYDELGDQEGSASCELELGWVAVYTNELDRADTLFERARERLERLGDVREAAEALRALGQVAVERGDLAQGETLLRRALERHEQIGYRKGMGSALRSLGTIAKRNGRLNEALTLYRKARKIVDAIGNTLGVAVCLNGEAEVARLQGDLEAAEAGYRRALRLHSALGSGAGVFIYLNLGLVLLSRNRRPEARDALEVAREVLEKAGRRGLLGSVHVQLCACSTGEWGAWDHHFERARRLLAESEMVDPDTAWAAQLAGDLARSTGERERARQAYELALAQWRGVGNAARIDEVLLTIRVLDSVRYR